MTELEVKLERIRDLLRQHSLDALLLQRVDNFAWATCGAASYVNLASSTGAASLLITPSGRWIVTDNIEAERLQQEERLRGTGLGVPDCTLVRREPCRRRADARPDARRGRRLSGRHRPFCGSAASARSPDA